MVELPHEDGVRKQHVDSHDMLHDVPFGFVAIAQFVDRSTRTDKPEIGTPSVEGREIVVENLADRVFMQNAKMV